MPYIGNDIRANNDYKTIDDISSSFNGSTTSFSLLVGGAAPVPFPKYETQLIISVGGVIQEPDSSGTTGFKLSGTNIVFSSAPASGENFFGVIFASADYLNAGGTFPDGTNTVPSITFSDDTDTGLFRVGSGTVAITSNGTKVAQFPTSTGNANQVLATDGAGTLSFVDQSGGGAVGGGSDKLFMENGTTMTTNYTIGTEFGATCNALSAGPITINAGVTLTIPSGSVYTVV
tara:strand:+ start:60 stop:755 length:696 start_codon:yes stop_codon:yes gene_type:complete